MLGDFNQRIPRKSAPQDLFAQLEAVLTGFRMASAGIVPDVDRQTVDHLAVSRRLSPARLRGLPATHDGRSLSDHFGISVCLQGR